MSETQDAGGVESLNDRRMKDMSFREKLIYLGKVIVFLISGGFIFPTIWVD